MNDQDVFDYDYAVFDREYFQSIKEVCKRLYAPESLNGDERRDIANKLQNIIWSACLIDESEVEI